MKKHLNKIIQIKVTAKVHDFPRVNRSDLLLSTLNQMNTQSQYSCYEGWEHWNKFKENIIAGTKLLKQYHLNDAEQKYLHHHGLNNYFLINDTGFKVLNLADLEKEINLVFQ